MNTSKKKILAISGSTKRNSTNEKILHHIKNTYQDLVTVELYEGIDQLPHFNPEKDHDKVDETVVDFRKQIEEADGILICTPEYVFSLPGSLKNAIEWTVSTTVFSNKPLSMIVASASGEKAFESLEHIMTTIEARIASKLLIKGAKGKVDGSGSITDQETIDGINTLVQALIKEIDVQDGVPSKYAKR